MLIKKIILSLLLFSVIIFSLTECTNIKKVTASDLDMRNITDVNDKKKRFFDFMRPIINDENAKVLALREQLVVAKNNNNNKSFVAETAKSYSIEWEEDEQDWNKLLGRVDAISLELALAQSANESAWGQSRFAQKGNNFFGQWCYKEGCGIIPKKRSKGTRHEVARFNSVDDSVRSYVKNINTGSVYAPLRKIRKNNRAAGKKPDARAQAGGLIKYSERREEYVKEIQAMIRANKELMLEE